MEVSPLPVAGFAGPELACSGTAVVWTDNSINPTTSLLTKTWTPLYDGAPSPSAGVLYDFGVPAPGDYGVALTVTTSAGCSDSVSASLFVGATPEAAFALEPVCAGVAVPLTLSDPAGYGRPRRPGCGTARLSASRLSRHFHWPSQLQRASRRPS